MSINLYNDLEKISEAVDKLGENLSIIRDMAEAKMNEIKSRYIQIYEDKEMSAYEVLVETAGLDDMGEFLYKLLDLL